MLNIQIPTVRGKLNRLYPRNLIINHLIKTILRDQLRLCLSTEWEFQITKNYETKFRFLISIMNKIGMIALVKSEQRGNPNTELLQVLYLVAQFLT